MIASLFLLVAMALEVIVYKAATTNAPAIQPFLFVCIGGGIGLIILVSALYISFYLYVALAIILKYTGLVSLNSVLYNALLIKFVLLDIFISHIF